MTSSLIKLTEQCLEARASELEGQVDLHQSSRSEFKRWSRHSQWLEGKDECLSVRLVNMEIPAGDNPDRPTRMVISFMVELTGE